MEKEIQLLIDMGARPTIRTIKTILENKLSNINVKNIHIISRTLIDMIETIPKDIIFDKLNSSWMALYALLTKYPINEEMMYELIDKYQAANFRSLAIIFPDVWTISNDLDYTANDQKIVQIIKNYVISIPPYSEKSHVFELELNLVTRLIDPILFFDHRGIKPSKRIVTKICKEYEYGLLKVMTDHYGIIPTKEDLDATLASEKCNLSGYNTQRYNTIKNIIDFRIIPDEKSLTSLNKPDLQLVKLLVHYGMPLNYDIISQLISLNMIKEGDDDFIEEGGLIYGDEMYHICHLSVGYPHHWDSKFQINPELIAMRITTDLTAEELIKKSIKSGIPIDRYCFENQCRYNSQTAIDLITKYGCKPTLNSLKYAIEHHNVKLVSVIINILKNDMGENLKLMCKPYDTDEFKNVIIVQDKNKGCEVNKIDKLFEFENEDLSQIITIPQLKPTRRHKI
jgi:hypothetical protein